MSQCSDIINGTDGKLGFTAANSMNFISSCREYLLIFPYKKSHIIVSYFSGRLAEYKLLSERKF